MVRLLLAATDSSSGRAPSGRGFNPRRQHGRQQEHSGKAGMKGRARKEFPQQGGNVWDHDVSGGQ
jgi:hypothetical protein